MHRMRSCGGGGGGGGGFWVRGSVDRAVGHTMKPGALRGFKADYTAIGKEVGQYRANSRYLQKKLTPGTRSCFTQKKKTAACPSHKRSPQ